MAYKEVVRVAHRILSGQTLSGEPRWTLGLTEPGDRLAYGWVLWAHRETGRAWWLVHETTQTRLVPYGIEDWALGRWGAGLLGLLRDNRLDPKPWREAERIARTWGLTDLEDAVHASWRASWVLTAAPHTQGVPERAQPHTGTRADV